MGSDDTSGESLQLVVQQTLSPHEEIQVQKRSAEHSETKKDRVNRSQRGATECGMEVRPFS